MPAGEPLQRKCPDCNVPLQPYMESTNGVDITIDRCVRCGGVWLDAGELERFGQAEVQLYLKAAFELIGKHVKHSEQSTDHATKRPG